MAVWFVCLGVIVYATTIYSNIFVGHSHWMLVRWIPYYEDRGTWLEYVRDLVQNVALFLPFGYAQYASTSALAPSTHRLRAIGLTALALSIAAELFQVYSHGRVPSTTDIVNNVAGAMLGGRMASRAGVKTPAPYLHPTTS